MPKQKKTQTQDVSTDQIIEAYLKDHKDEHYNFEKEQNYTVSSGSLLLDIEMNGGIRPGVVGPLGFQKVAKHLAL